MSRSWIPRRRPSMHVDAALWNLCLACRGGVGQDGGGRTHSGGDALRCSEGRRASPGRSRDGRRRRRAPGLVNLTTPRSPGQTPGGAHTGSPRRVRGRQRHPTAQYTRGRGLSGRWGGMRRRHPSCPRHHSHSLRRSCEGFASLTRDGWELARSATAAGRPCWLAPLRCLPHLGCSAHDPRIVHPSARRRHPTFFLNTDMWDL